MISRMSLVPCVVLWFEQVRKLLNDPCSLWGSVVQGGSVGLNHPKLMSSSTPGSVCGTMVRKGSEELNHHELIKSYPMILAPSGTQLFEEVQ